MDNGVYGENWQGINKKGDGSKDMENLFKYTE